jgi:hypothetical protein
MKKSTQTLIAISKEVGLAANIEIAKYMLVSHHQNAIQNRDIKIANNLKMCQYSNILK